MSEARSRKRHARSAAPAVERCRGPPRRRIDAAYRRLRGVGRRIVAGGETVYGVNTGFGLLANTRIPADSPRGAPDQPDPLAQRRPRRSAAAPRRPADDRPQAARARARLFGGPPAGDRGASAAARRRCHAAHSRRRGASARRGDLAPLAHLDLGADGLRPHRLAGDVVPAAAALRTLGLAAAAARAEGGPGADQRHAGS